MRQPYNLKVFGAISDHQNGFCNVLKFRLHFEALKITLPVPILYKTYQNQQFRILPLQKCMCSGGMRACTWSPALLKNICHSAKVEKIVRNAGNCCAPPLTAQRLKSIYFEAIKITLRIPILLQNLSIPVVQALTFPTMYKLQGYEVSHLISGPPQKFVSR